MIGYIKSIMDHSSYTKKLSPVIPVIVGIILMPRDAFAWGPVAHIDFSMQILAGAVALSPAIKRLLGRRTADFLYGSLAADAVIGKNFAKSAHTHCHSWSVAKKLFKQAKNGEPAQAFILGYFCHLATDILAHNHFVPDRLVALYQAKGVGHLYWEARFDQKLLEINPGVGETWKYLSARKFEDHDRFLAEQLEPTLFSHEISTHLFKRSLEVQRHRPWQNALRQIDARSKLPISVNEIQRWRTVSLAMAGIALNEPMNTELDKQDPVGRVALENAVSHRRLLRRRSYGDPLVKPRSDPPNRSGPVFSSYIPPRYATRYR